MFTKKDFPLRSEKTHKCPNGAIVIFWLLLVGMLSSAFGQDEINFHFNPPDGSTFIETLRYTKSLSAPGVLQPETRVMEQKGKYTIRKTPVGYSVVVTPIQPKLRVSEGTEGIIRSMLSTVVITYDLNTGGQLVRVRGAEAVMEKLKEMVPQELYEAVLSAIGPAAQNPAELAANGWVGRGMLGMFAGRTLRIGHVYQETGNVPLLIGGSTRGTVTVKTSWPVPCSNRRCARVETMYYSNDQSIGEKLGLMLRTMLLNLMKALDPSIDEEKIPEFQVTESRSTVENRRLVDPSTGLLYSENTTTTLEASFGVEKEDKSKFVIKELLEYTYEYQ